MLINNTTNINYTPRQLKLPLEIEKLIDISDPVYTFCEVMDHIYLSKYFVAEGYKTGCPRCDEQKLLKVILFAFMENGISSLRDIEKLCRNDIRYLYLLDDMKAPSLATFGNFIRNELTDSIEQIFLDVNTYIFQKDHVDLEHTYIDGTKIEANANRYIWVQLHPAYNLQTAVCDEYIAVVDVKPYASDMECFVPLMEKFKKTYGRYPKYPVADAGYGSYNDYLYCEEHGMEKYMKFTMFKKETTDKKYQENPYRTANFKRDESGNLLCPDGKTFRFKYKRLVYKNKYGRTEELYECESCEGCQHKKECCPKASGNRTIHMNAELTAIHEEVISNLESIHGALLRMNPSIQAEGTFGVLNWDKSYKRLYRRGEKNVILELTLISCGFNIYKYHNKKQRKN